MKTFVQILLLGSAVALSLSVAPSPASGQDDYWVSRWNWYDNVYRPYYYRSYSSPAYSSYYGPSYYAPSYSTYGYGYGPYYSPYSYGPYSTYYGVPGAGVYPGAGVARVGPLRFGWR